MIDKETIQKIQDAARIEEVVGEFVSLKRHGSSYIACCPFHNEKTPSFHVNPARGIFKCFGCGEGGDSVGFLMKHEHYTYPEALRYLAQKYHIDIKEERQSEEDRQRESVRDGLFHATEFAQKYFADLLFNDDVGTAVGLSYFHHRGLSDEMIKRFGLGYCKDVWDDFTSHALKNGYSAEVLEKTGLTVVGDSGRKYDRFRGRVMFPIYSISGRVLAFSGRVLSKEAKAAKYVNSPESEIYVKGNILFGLFQARQAIAKADKCYLVEGNVDVVSMHQSGVENTVASCGTALTQAQIRLIKRYTSNVTVLYDGDSAGIKATLKAVDLLFAEGMHVRMVLFPDAEDPDSYAQKYGSQALQDYLKNNEENFLMYRMRLANDEIRRDPIRKAELEQKVVQTIALVPDALERGEYVKQAASVFEVAEQTLSVLVAKAIVNKVKSDEKKSIDEESRQAGAADAVQQVPAEALPSTPDTGSPQESPAMATGDPYGLQSSSIMGDSCERQEESLVKLLVCFGDKVIGECTVAELIVNDLMDDELSFDHVLFQRIFDIYKDHVLSGTPLPDANFYVKQDDVAIRNKVLGMMMEGYQLSPKWASRDIVIPSIEDRLEQDVRETLLSFKMKKVEQRMAAVDQQLRQVTDEDELLRLLAWKKQLVDIHIKIGCDELRRVIS